MTTIPKHLHGIWLGPKPLPDSSADNFSKWRLLHPDWKFTLWNEEMMMQALTYWREWDLRSVIMHNPKRGIHSDIFRLLILKHVGGVYVDGDMEPVKAIDPLLESVTNGCFIADGYNGRVVQSAVIGAAPRHGSIMDALDSMRLHMRDQSVNQDNAALATGPLYLTKVWKDDERITRLPRDVFYPYDWHEPWKENEPVGPDTYAIHRWDGSWIDEMSQKQVVHDSPLGVCVVYPDRGDDYVHDPIRHDLVWESHKHQSLSPESRLYTPSLFLQHRDAFAARIRALEGCQRVLFVPWDHVLDRNLCEAHALLPQDAIGVTRTRLFSSAKLFSLRNRKTKAFPFEVFKIHGWERPKETDEISVFSISRNDLLEILDDPSDEMISAKDWPTYAAVIITDAVVSLVCRLSGTRLTRTTWLAPFPVNEFCGENNSAK